MTTLYDDDCRVRAVVAAHNGYNYSLAVFGEQQDQPAIDETMHNFLNGIKPNKPGRVARTNSKSRLNARPA